MAGPVATTCTSASWVSGTEAVAALLAATGSGVAEDTVEVAARVVAVALEATPTTMLAVADAPGASGADSVQLTVPPVGAQVPPGTVAETNEVPAGSGVLSTTPSAVEGPVLVIVLATVAVRPAVTAVPAAGVIAVATPRSALRETAVAAVATLLVVTSSAVSEETCTELVTAPVAAPAATRAVIGTVSDRPTPVDPPVQVTVWPDAEHVVPAGGAADWNVTPAGRVSVNVVVPVGFGPLLAAPIV